MDLDTRKAKAGMMSGREARTIAGTEMRSTTDGSTMTLNGYASVTGVGYDMGWYQERIAPGAFMETLSKQPDVQLLINHEGLPLARTGRNMTLTEDETGLHVSASLDANDPDVQRLASKMSGGLIDQMSFAFRVMTQVWDEDYTDRNITEVSLDRGDVSVVNQGASPTTSVTLRSLLGNPGLTEEQIDELRQDPAVMAVVRRLTSPTAVSVVEAAAGIADAATPITSNLDFYRARAYAHALRK